MSASRRCDLPSRTVHFTCLLLERRAMGAADKPEPRGGSPSARRIRLMDDPKTVMPQHVSQPGNAIDIKLEATS